LKQHTELIICPVCSIIQAATVEHTYPFLSYVHECINCGYVITETEWERLKGCMEVIIVNQKELIEYHESPRRKALEKQYQESIASKVEDKLDVRLRDMQSQILLLRTDVTSQTGRLRLELAEGLLHITNVENKIADIMEKTQEYMRTVSDIIEALTKPRIVHTGGGKDGESG